MFVFVCLEIIQNFGWERSFRLTLNICLTVYKEFYAEINYSLLHLVHWFGDWGRNKTLTLIPLDGSVTRLRE